MNRLTIVLLIIVLAGGTVAYFQLSHEGPEKDKYRLENPRDFSIRNISDVHHILIADRDGEVINIDKRDNGWILNDKYPARSWSINNMLNNIKKSQIQSIPNKEKQKYLIEAFNVNGIKVVLRGKENKIINSFIVGPESLDGTACYFKKEDGGIYLIEIKSFVGSPRTVFEAEVSELRSVNLLTNRDKSVNEIIVNYPAFKNESFHFTRIDDEYNVKPLNKDAPVASTKFNRNKANSYYLAFERVFGEVYKPNLKIADSLLNESPFVTFDIVRNNNDTSSLTMWPTESIKSIKDADNIEGVKETGKSIPRLWVHTDKGDWLLMQIQPNKNIFRGYSYFYQ